MKKILYYLSPNSLYGLNKKIKKKMCKKIGVNFRVRSEYLKVKHKSKVNFFLKSIKLGTSLRKKIQNNIKFYKKIKNFRGNRHQFGYPVRGQRTHTNRKTRRRLNKKPIK